MRIVRPYILRSVLLALVLATGARGSIVFVDDDAAPGGDGLSWATAFTSLQTAIIEATGDSPITEIRVAAGTYPPDAAMDRTATFGLRTGVAIRGGFAGHGAVDPNARDVAQFVSILTGDLAGDDEPVDLDPFAGTDENSYHVVTATDVDATAILDGFVVEAGNSLGALVSFGAGILVSERASPTLTNLVVRHNQANAGAGVWLGGGATLLSNSVIEGNAAESGGGIGISGLVRPTVSQCTIANNRADRGGGIWLDSFAGLIIDCHVHENEATLDGGGIGGNLDVLADIIGSRISNNVAGERGGGVFVDRGSLSRVWQCVIFANTATDGAGISVVEGLEFDLANTQLNGNTATEDGGGVWWLDSLLHISNCTIYGNTAFLGGGVHGTSLRFLDNITIRNSWP